MEEGENGTMRGTDRGASYNIETGAGTREVHRAEGTVGHHRGSPMQTSGGVGGGSLPDGSTSWSGTAVRHRVWAGRGWDAPGQHRVRHLEVK